MKGSLSGSEDLVITRKFQCLGECRGSEGNVNCLQKIYPTLIFFLISEYYGNSAAKKKLCCEVKSRGNERIVIKNKQTCVCIVSFVNTVEAKF